MNLNDNELKNIFDLNQEIRNQTLKVRKNTSNISGYNLFTREMFSSIKQDNEGLATKDLLRIIASLWNLWKNTDQDIKDHYNFRSKSISPKTKQEKLKNNKQNTIVKNDDQRKLKENDNKVQKTLSIK